LWSIELSTTRPVWTKKSGLVYPTYWNFEQIGTFGELTAALVAAEAAVLTAHQGLELATQRQEILRWWSRCVERRRRRHAAMSQTEQSST
jgi:hypothetical protein